MGSTRIMWFRRDLRLSDNPALVEACGADEVVPLFVLDPSLWESSGANRRWFLHGCLAALNEAIGGSLVVREGDPSVVVPAVAREVEAEAVVLTDDFGPFGMERDERVESALDHCEFRRVGTPYVSAPGSIRTGSDTPYKVFTPYHRAWLTAGFDDPVTKPRSPSWLSGVTSDGLPTCPDVDTDLPAPGEAAAKRRLEAFLASHVDDYNELRDDPARDATSRLSAHLKFGCLHPRQILARLDRRNTGHDTFAKELAWRDFYGQVLWDRPASAWTSWKDKFSNLEWDTGADADERFEAWCTGHTGYPLVDAGMRQLLAEGWMHNRVRMITASFLVKDLHIDWVRGARHFMTHLVDADLASNNHGWQWAAGTGTDAQPWHRIFNPITQSERFDPSGDYIRRWVPELRDLDAAAIHAPWRHQDSLFDGAVTGDYAGPVVDHAEEREAALARYRAAGEG